MAEESQFMLYALLMGAFITFVYDLLRVFRRVISHNGFWVSVEDLAFWGFCAVEVFLLMYHVSNGNLRWFAVLGALVGMVLYSKLIGRFLVKYLSLLLGKIFAVIAKGFQFLFRPVKKTAGFACGLAGKTTNQFFTFLKNRLTAMRKVLTMIICKK